MSGFSFGSSTPAASNTPAAGGFSFGSSTPAASNTPAAGGFSFGSSTPAASNTPAAGGFSFGSSTPAASNNPAAGGLSFGSSTPAASNTLAAGGLSFGSSTPAASNTLAAGGFSFGAKPAGITSAATTTVAAGSTSAQTTSSGLGGMSLAATGALGAAPSSTAGKAATDGAATVARDQPVPAEVQQTVELLRAHIKTQKAECEGIARHSWTPVQRCADDTAQLCQLRATAAAVVQRNAAAAGRLKRELCTTLVGAEVARHTSDTSPALQAENTAPDRLFASLVTGFQATLTDYRRQIELIQQLVAGGNDSTAVAALASTKHVPLDCDHVVSVIRRQHDTFVGLASRLYSMHEKVGQLKEQVIALMKQRGEDPIDLTPAPPVIIPAVNNVADSSLLLLPSNLAGPSPFTSARSTALSSFVPQLPVATATAAPLSSGAGLFASPSLHQQSLGASTPSTSSSLFAGSSTGFQQQSSSQFNSPVLSAVPTGSKRGKM